MKILGIENRTENWKTVQHFYGLSNEKKERLARHLLANHYEITPDQVQLGSDDVRIELFWKGMRDYVSRQANKPNPGEITDTYMSEFADLRERVKKFNPDRPVSKFKKLNPHNYDASPDNRKTLFSNLEKTEIDIVIETDDCILIGEAKHESKLKGDGKLILVHQLIRQYVMATVLSHLVSKREGYPRRTVVPFVVVDKDDIIKTAQIGFMTSQDRGNGTGRKWMSENNVLTWEEIKGLSGCP